MSCLIQICLFYVWETLLFSLKNGCSCVLLSRFNLINCPLTSYYLYESPMQSNKNIFQLHEFVLVLIHMVCGILLWIYRTKCGVLHKYNPLFSVLGALSAAGKVIIAKQGQTVTLECGVNTYSENLEWKNGNNLILYRPKKRGFPRNGTSRQTLDNYFEEQNNWPTAQYTVLL